MKRSCTFTACLLLALGLPAAADTYVVGGVNASLDSHVDGLAYDPWTDTLYGSRVGGEGLLLRIDPHAGTSTVIGPLGFVNVRGLAFDPGSHTLYGADLATNVLLVIDRGTGTGTPIGSPAGPIPASLAFDPVTDTLYGLGADGLLSRVDTATGALTALGWVGVESLLTTFVGLSCDEHTGALYASGKRFAGLAVPAAGSLWRIDPATLETEPVSPSWPLPALGLAPGSAPPTLFAAMAEDVSAASFLASVDPASGVFVPAGHPAPGADFANIQAAIAWAHTGDTLRVLPGRYTTFRLDKGLSIVGSHAGDVTVFGDPAFWSGAPFGGLVHDLPAGETAVLSGLLIRGFAGVTDCDGHVVLRDVDVLGGVWIEDSADARIHDSRIQGAAGACDPLVEECLFGANGFPGVVALRSNVDLVRSQVWGGPGTCGPDPCLGLDCGGGDGLGPGEAPACGWGGAGVRVDDSTLFAALSTLGAGGGGGSSAALRIWAGSDVTLAGTPETLIQGAGGLAAWVDQGATLRHSGVTLAGAVVGLGEVVNPPVPDPVLMAWGAASPGALSRLQVRGPPGARARLLVGWSPDRVSTRGTLVDRLLEPMRTYDQGAIDRTGQLDLGLTLPAGWPDDALLILQTELELPDGERLRTNALMP